MALTQEQHDALRAVVEKCALVTNAARSLEREVKGAVRITDPSKPYAQHWTWATAKAILGPLYEAAKDVVQVKLDALPDLPAEP